MYPVSEEYKDAIYAPERRTAARVVFSMVDPATVASSTASLPPGALISRPEQCVNNRWDTTRRYATFEPEYWRLDGTFVLPPGPGELLNDEVGWWSEVLCDGEGLFDPPLTLTVNLATPFDLPGLGVAFDRAAEEYAADFDLVITADGQTITREIRDNADALFVLWETFEAVSKVELVIYRWRTRYRRARVVELLLGPVEEFGREKLTRLTVLTEIDPLCKSAPAGELTFVVDNSDKRFNLLNPEGLVTYLHERQRIVSRVGVEVNGVFEWVDTGVFYLREWASDEGSLTASFTARCRLDLLDEGAFSATHAQPTTLHDVALAVLQYAGVPATNYVLPSFLEDVSTVGKLDKVAPRQALLYVAQAAQSVLLVDREDRIRFVCLPVEPTAVDGIDYANAYQKPKIEQEVPLGSVQVSIYDSGGQVIDTYEMVTDQAGQTRRIDNPLITSEALAAEVAQWIVVASSYRFLYTADWRQNPALEPGDAITIQDDYGQNLTSLVTQQDLEFDGALRGTTRTRGSW